jgi:hypothetical protein
MERPNMGGRIAIWCAVSLLWLHLCGCGAIDMLFTEQFVDATLGGRQVSSLPGDAPALLVGVQNGTDRVVEAAVTYRTVTSSGQSATETYTVVLAPFDQTLQALICPIEEITLGDLSNLNSSGAVIRLGNGTAADPYIEVEPFGVVLKEGINYDCGDSLTFVVQPSGATKSGYQTFVYIRRARR